MDTTLNIQTNAKELRLEANILLAVKKKERYWIVYSPHFKTFGYSSVSEDEAKKDFKNSLNIFFDVHINRNTLEIALEKLGWERSDGTFVKPKYFNIPSYLLAAKSEEFSIAR